MPNAPDLEFLALQEVLIGRYSLEREIGRGGMGIVYLAHEVRLDRPVALKLLPPEYAAQPTLRERFLREARTVAKLSHPNIVPIHAVDEVDDFVFIVMAYVEGGTLGQRVRERGPLPPSEATRILCEVSWALAYAHSQGVVHRDVKPDNILLEAGSGRALVTDFGIAQVSEGPGLTGVGEVLGTAEFISPEQASGEAVDERSDIYSLGVVGHYVVSGRLPFEAPTVSALLAKHITQAAPPLSGVAPETPRHLAKAIDRCLAKDPAERFPNGEALAEALSRSLEVRREVPVALRVFVKQNRERFRGFMWFAGVVFYSLFVPFVLLLEEGEPLFALIFSFGWALLAVAPGGMLISMVRQLLRSGYGYDELVLAFKNDIELRREELAFEFGGKQTWVDHLATGLAYGGLAVCGAATAALFFVDLSVASLMETIFAVFGGGIAVSLGAAVVASNRAEDRRGLPGERWLKFWKGRVGRWMFKIARFGLKRVASADMAYRPTEMAIGMAADRLYEDLPKELRKSFGELPEVVRTLERDAEQMRARVTELNGILNDIENDDVVSQRRTAAAAPGVADKRASLKSDLQETRDAAEGRLAELLASLETIRLDLLRMHAGSGSVESMTADLTSARELSDEVQLLLDGRREVDALLALEKPGG